MARVADPFTPPERGKLWRSLYNSIRNTPAYSPEAYSAFSEFAFNQFLDDFSGPLKSEAFRKEIEPKVTQSIERAFMLVQRGEKGLVGAFKNAVKLLPNFRDRLHLTDDRLADPLKLFTMGVGYRTPKSKDSRSDRQRMIDFLYSAGYCHIYRDFELVFATCAVSHVDHLELLGLSENDAKGSWPDTIWLGPFERTIKLLFASDHESHGKRLWARYCDFFDIMYRIRVLGDLEILRRMARAVWSYGPDEYTLDPAEFLVLRHYLTKATFDLDVETFVAGVPSALELSSTRSLRAGRRFEFDDLMGLYTHPVQTQLLIRSYIDFWDELEYFNKVESYKGSFECAECRALIPRSFDSHGQLYCSEQCKKRAAYHRSRWRKQLRPHSVD